MRRSMLLVCLLPLAVWSADAALKAEGERVYLSHGCYGCHGVSGEGVNNFPRLSGKSAAYLAERLKALKKGKGRTPKKEIMVPYAKALDEKQIEAVSAYLASAADASDENLEVPEDILGGSNM